MAKRTWAKIVEVNDSQVVILRGSDNDNGEHVAIIYDFDGMQIKTSLCFEDDVEGANTAFENIKLSAIEEQYNELLKMMSDEETEG